MKELVVLSGKGGTGKTSLVACYAALAERCVVADCDVDVPDLHLVLRPSPERREPFVGGRLARIRSGLCIACGKCEEVCRFDAIRFDGPGNGRQPRTFRVDPMACEGCGVCAWFCAERAIAFELAERGQLLESATRVGPLLHGRLRPPAANSGKLVSLLRQRAHALGEQLGISLLLTDGSPGIGCPVIASLTGASLVLIVAEPSLSGRHDVERVLRLADRLRAPCALCVNRADVAPELADDVEALAREHGAHVIERVPEDQRFMEAQQRATSLVELGRGGAATAIERGWKQLLTILEASA